MEVPDSEVASTVASLIGLIRSSLEYRLDPEFATSRHVSSISDCLVNFSEILLYKDPQLISSLDRDLIATVLISAVSYTPDSVLDQALACVQNFWEASPNSITPFLELNFTTTLHTRVEDASDSTICTIVNILWTISHTHTAIVCEQFGIGPLLALIGRCRPAEQSRAMSLIARIATNGPYETHAAALPGILHYFQGWPELKSEAIRAFAGIVQHGGDIPPESLPAMATVIATDHDARGVLCVLESLVKLSRFKQHAQSIARTPFDFERLLLGAQFGANNDTIVRQALFLILALIPRPDDDFDRRFRPKPVFVSLDGLGGFLQNLFDLLERFVLGDGRQYSQAIFGLGVLPRLLGTELSAPLCSRLASLAIDPDLAEVILYAALAGDPAQLRRTGLYQALCAVTRPVERRRFGDWFEQGLAVLEERMAAVIPPDLCAERFECLRDLIVYLGREPVSPFDFEQAGLVGQAVGLLRNHDPGDRLDLKPLGEIALELLAFSALPSVESMFGDRPPESLAIGRLNYYVVRDGLPAAGAALPHFSAFAGLEALLNEAAGLSRGVIAAAFPELLEERLAHLTETERGLLYRVLAPDGYRRYTFSIDDHNFSYLDSTFHASTRLLPTQAAIKTTVPTIICKPEDAGQTHLNLMVSSAPRPVAIGDRLELLLEFADRVHAVDPDLPMASARFEERLRPLAKVLFACVCLLNPIVPIVFGHPYLFSTEFKASLFRVCSTDMFSGMAFAQSSVLGLDQKLCDGRSFWSPTIRRDHLLEDGVQMLRTLGPGPLQLDVQFAGESGFGAGPTREFCDLMAKSLSAKSRNMWRHSDGKSAGDFAFTEIGLFPRPDADPELFYVLGLLIGKAITHGIVLPLPISEAFFRLTADLPVELGEVDPAYARLIENRDNVVGLPYTYPGIDDLEMVENGANLVVSEIETDKYIRLLKEFTVGKKLDKIVRRFRDGFFAVIESGLWEKFTPAEMARIVSGDAVRWTMPELDRNIRFEHGYVSKSPQRQRLFDTILDFDEEQKAGLLRFITGCERLPIGGLGALRPKITVAKRVIECGKSPDECLPTVSTCSNYFKLPAYSCRAVMAERLLLAISEGQEEFGLS
jgi:hypothetical protein